MKSVMKSMSIRVITLLVITVVSTQCVHGTLVGDEITFNRVIPSENWEWGEVSVIVEEGPGDIVSLSGGNNTYINPEATSILCQFGPSSWSGGPFDDHRILIFDIDTQIVDLTFDTNINGMTSDRIAYTASSIEINHSGLNGIGNEYLNLHLTLVPEPATLLLLGMGGLLIRKRRLL